MRAIIAHDDNVDTAEAVSAVLADCERQLAGEWPRGALLFTTTEYQHEFVLRAIQDRWPGLPLIGSTTDGEISSRLGYRDDSICLTLLVGDELEIVTGHGTDSSLDVEAALDRALAPLDGRRPALCMALCVGTSGNPGALVAALHERLKLLNCPIVGGLSGDHAVARSTLQFFGAEACHDSVALMFVCGNVHASWGAASGWFPIGIKHRITRSSANRVFEIDGKPALEMYQSFWGEHAITHLGEFPLAVSDASGDGSFYLRAAVTCNAAEGSVDFAGDLPVDSLVQLTEVVPAGLLSGSESSIRIAAANFTGAVPSIALMFSCAARKWVLGSRAKEEIGLLLRSFDELSLPRVDLAGFYAFGEICPLSKDGPPMLHNQTCVTVLIGK